MKTGQETRNTSEEGSEIGRASSSLINAQFFSTFFPCFFLPASLLYNERKTKREKKRRRRKSSFDPDHAILFYISLYVIVKPFRSMLHFDCETARYLECFVPWMFSPGHGAEFSSLFLSVRQIDRVMDDRQYDRGMEMWGIINWWNIQTMVFECSVTYLRIFVRNFRGLLSNELLIDFILIRFPSSDNFFIHLETIRIVFKVVPARNLNSVLWESCFQVFLRMNF